jgi:magnesium transporter
MRKFIKGRSKESGLPPGTPVYVGPEKAAPVRLSVIDYDEHEFAEKRLDSVEECFPFTERPTVTWVNVDGIHEEKVIRNLARHFRFHPLVQEDIVNTTQRPKVEDYDSYLFVVLKMLQWDERRQELTAEQVSLVLGERFVLSFQERPGDVFEAVRERLRTGKGRVRAAGADYLAYSLIDAVVDGYFGVLEGLGDRLETLEQVLISRPTPQTLREIHTLKREGLFLRKSVWPLREVISGLQRGESKLIASETAVYLRDVYDHTIQVIDTMETIRDMLAGMVDTYLSSVSNRMNEVMKVLTIIATIFIPLTFIAGVYGMNFQPDAGPLNMPELRWAWGYPAVLVVMAVVAALMVLYFRRKRWI